MKKPLNYFGSAFDNPRKGYNKDYLKTKEGKKEIKRNKKYSKKIRKQLEERGFDDSECWNLYITISKFILPRLKRLKEIQHGHPVDLSENEWNKILDKMINSFKEILKDEINQDYHKIKKGLKLFSKYFLNLWD